MEDRIIVRGAWEHNLKGVDVDLPRDSLIVCTGVSGSGKSSLAFDTIYQEGQRRFLESLSAYARQFLGQMEKPRVDHIEGLSPTICIDQKTINRNPRSTVGTITEIYDHLRLLFARLGTPHCPECGSAIAHQTPGQIADLLYMEGAGKRGMILAPIVTARKGEYRKELKELQRDGYLRARIDGEVQDLSEDIVLDRYVRHTIEVVLDRVVFDRESRSRIVEALEVGIAKTGGLVSALIEEEHHLFAANRACPNGHMSIPELEPRFFSFNSPQGACPRCDGLGEVTRFHPHLIIPDEGMSIAGGAIQCLTKEGRVPFSYLGIPEIAEILPKPERDLHKPWGHLPQEVRTRILEGDPKDPDAKADPSAGRRYVGVIPAMERSYRYTRASFMERFLKRDLCPVCEGKRLHPISLGVTFQGKNIWDLSTQTVTDARIFFRDLKVDGTQALIGREIFKEIQSRLGFLEEVGLGYLSLDRSAATLSGGEAQRIRLASQVGSGLQGVLYVLDEPSIGLHPRDNRRLIETLLRLRDQGNTVLVVEHDRETMEAADYLLDIGPGAGKLGGQIVSAGTPEQVRQGPGITGRYLRDEEIISLPERRRPIGGETLTLRGVTEHNLKEIDVAFPLGTLTVVTGVSGSGKSTLVVDILHKALAHLLHGAKERPESYRSIEGLEHVDKVIEIDQAPIGRTPRSNPATYTGVMDPIRDLFADTPTSRRRGYSKSRFSFNVEGGRCEHCKGSGVKIIEMQFMADVEIPCEYCDGDRFKPSTLEVKYRGQSIGDVLKMTVSEAAEFFSRLPKISRILETMDRVGLGYVSLGQPSTTLSGGEAQRVKLASELHRPATGKTLYILDEPTTGLHMSDVKQLIGAIQALVDSGNTVVVIEHSTDLIKVADHLIDMGPEGGAGGGRIVGAGTPEEIADIPESYTGRVLRPILGLAPLEDTGGIHIHAAVRSEDLPPRAPGKRERALVVKGAHLHNLRHVDVSIPHDKLTVVTGVSGSGKTSLAFDTLFAEGQRRYVESMSTYARRFLGRLDKAPLESIEGIAPAISVDQKTAPRNPRSTVATTTEIYDYLRLLFARVGIPHSPISGLPLVKFSAQTAAEAVLEAFPGRRGEILTFLPLESDERTAKGKADPARLRQIGVGSLLSQGYTKVKVDGTLVRLDRPGAPLLLKGRDIEIIMDRVTLQEADLPRIVEGFEKAFDVGDGIAWFQEEGGERRGFSTALGCMASGYFLSQELTPRLFSFNSHVGACPRCDGLGTAQIFSEDALFPDPSAPLLEMLSPHARKVLERGGAKLRAIMEAMARLEDIPLDAPWESLAAEDRAALMMGTGETLYEIPKGKGRAAVEEPWPGIIPALDAYLVEMAEGRDRLAKQLLGLMFESTCPACHGLRLKPLPRAVLIRGENISALCQRTVSEVRAFLEGIAWDSREETVALPILREAISRLSFLQDVGLEYLTLDRASATLSGGESQRIRLASQLGSHLVGVLYVLDEPTVGLHPRDTARLLTTLEGLRDRGNTVVIVEHDKDTMTRADYLIDMGPGAGERGGRIVSAGHPREVCADPRSLTGAFLSGRRYIPQPSERQAGVEGVWVYGARGNNLKGVDAHFKRGQLTCVTGVSGSGKSTLVMEILAKALSRDLNGASDVPADHDRVKINPKIQKMAVIDQSPLGRSPKSNPATYVGAMGPIRDIFAGLPESRARGYTKSRFSFNVAGGRCASCDGRGAIKVEMHFLSDVWVTCEQCKGRRFNDATLEVKFKGKTIAEVLKMEVDDALTFFAKQRKVARLLQPLSEVGLGYLSLGQAATTLSGGEAQRVKLATALLSSQQPCVYILDEPTTGLHFADVEKLILVLRRLVEHGHAVVVIEHNPDMMKVADAIVDLGPEGGARGGEIVAVGTPEAVSEVEESITGVFLKGFLAEERARERGIAEAS